MWCVRVFVRVCVYLQRQTEINIQVKQRCAVDDVDVDERWHALLRQEEKEENRLFRAQLDGKNSRNAGRPI